MRMSVHEHAAIVVNHLRQHYSERFGSNDDHDTAAGRDANYNMIGKSRSNAELRLSSAVEVCCLALFTSISRLCCFV